MKVKTSDEVLEKANAIAAELFSVDLYQVTQKQLDFVLSLVLGVEVEI